MEEKVIAALFARRRHGELIVRHVYAALKSGAPEVFIAPKRTHPTSPRKSRR